MSAPATAIRGASQDNVPVVAPVWAGLNVADLVLLRWLVPLAILHGLLFVVLIPPWQHYDEPTHFLYAAGLAAGEVDAPGPASALLSREIADSMYRFRFFAPAYVPNILGLEPPGIGFSQRGHPPLYYALVAAALGPFTSLSVEAQLYVARAVSLILYTLTVLTAWRIAVALAPDEPLVQLVIPLLTLLAPAFADIMSAVNNDVLLNFSLTVALLGAVLLVRDGPRPLPLALALLGLGVAILTKRTAMIAVVPLLLALLWAVWRTPLRWWGLPLFAAATALTAFAVIEPLQVGGPAGARTVLALRPWLDTLGREYLRTPVDSLVRSLSDPTLIGDRYWTVLRVGFEGYHTHFAWGYLTLHPAWALLLAGVTLVALVGLIVGGVRRRDELPLWQRRSLWVFFVSVVVAWASLFLRLHPLPPLDKPVYIPRARYMFWALVPTLWLLALGLSWAAPARWWRAAMVGLIGLFVCLNLAAWLWTITRFYYV
jgi:Predicted membrane protein (DUF2142)